MGFSRGHLSRVMIALYNGKQLEIINDFIYLDVVLRRTCNLKKAKQCQTDKATKALYEILKLGQVHNLSINCQLDLFDKICEVWRYRNNEILERVQFKFCKLKSKATTPSSKIYGELRTYPIEIKG